MTRQDRPAPGVVHVRLTGIPADAEALAAVLAGTPGVQILTGPDGPYPSRRQPGHRLYLTVRLTQPPITSAPTGQMEGNPMSTDPAAAPGPGAVGPDAPVPCTLTPQADAYLDALPAGLSPAGPDPEASL